MTGALVIRRMPRRQARLDRNSAANRKVSLLLTCPGKPELGNRGRPAATQYAEFLRNRHSRGDDSLISTLTAMLAWTTTPGGKVSVSGAGGTTASMSTAVVLTNSLLLGDTGARPAMAGRSCSRPPATRWRFAAIRVTRPTAAATLRATSYFDAALSTDATLTEVMRAANSSLQVSGDLTVTAGVVVAFPTGGNKGAGTVNATAVYGNNVLLTSDERLKADIEPCRHASRWSGRSNPFKWAIPEELPELPNGEGRLTLDELAPAGFSRRATWVFWPRRWARHSPRPALSRRTARRAYRLGR